MIPARTLRALLSDGLRYDRSIDFDEVERNLAEHFQSGVAGAGVVVRSDNDFVFVSRLYRRLLASYGLRQEFIHPHTPEQNGVVKA